MPFTPTTWADSPATTSPLDAANLNNMASQYLEAVSSFEQDLFTPFVFSGLVATKDGTNASQLDVTAGVAFPLQTDGTLRRRAPTSSTQSTTGHPSTTLFLDLNPDGSWSWGTSHSAVSGHLIIASVTTDSSAHIATVTDARTLSTTLLSGMGGGSITIPVQLIANRGVLAHPDGTGDDAVVLYDRNSVLGATMGWAQSGGGLYAFDTVNGGFIFDGATKTGITFSGGIIAGGSLTVAGIASSAGIFQQGSEVALTGAHSAGQILLSYGAGVPGALGSNEIYFQVS